MREFCKNPSDAKHLIVTITALVVIVLLCCNPSPYHHKYLSVPYESQLWNGWCGAACIQMRAKYDYRNPTQESIASFIGWQGTNPYNIAMGVNYFTNESGYAGIYGSTEVEQDRAMSAQVASVNNNIPSISIVQGGYHAVIANGFSWTSTVTGPRADGVRFHDPMPYVGPNMYVTSGVWKQQWFTAYNGQHAIILGFARYRGEGESGYNEFLNQGGTYYGGPEEYNPQMI